MLLLQLLLLLLLLLLLIAATLTYCEITITLARHNNRLNFTKLQAITYTNNYT